MSKSESSNEKKTRVFLGRDAWVQYISDFKQSGLTQPEYAKRHELNLTTFQNWIAKLKRESCSSTPASTTFVPVKVNPTLLSVASKEPVLNSGDLHIQLPNGIVCSFPSNHAPNLILPWIEYLRIIP